MTVVMPVQLAAYSPAALTPFRKNAKIQIKTENVIKKEVSNVFRSFKDVS